MKIITAQHTLALAHLIFLIKQAIIDSGKVNLGDFKDATPRFHQLLLGRYNAFDEDKPSFVFDNDKNFIITMSKIANGKQNVGYEIRNLIQNGIYKYADGRVVEINPISPDMIKLMVENYTTLSKRAELIRNVYEIIKEDKKIMIKDYYDLCNSGSVGEFIYKALTEIAVSCDVFNTDFCTAYVSTDKNSARPKPNIATSLRNAYNYVNDSVDEPIENVGVIAGNVKVSNT